MSVPTDKEFADALSPALEALEERGLTFERAGVLFIGFGYKMLADSGLTRAQIEELVAREWPHVISGVTA